VLQWKLAKQGHPPYSTRLDLQDSKFEAQIEWAKRHKPKEVLYALLVDGNCLAGFEDGPFPLTENFPRDSFNSIVADITKRFHEVTSYAKCETFLYWGFPEVTHWLIRTAIAAANLSNLVGAS